MIEKLRELELELLNAIGDASMRSKEHSSELRYQTAFELGYLSSRVKHIASELRDIHSTDRKVKRTPTPTSPKSEPLLRNSNGECNYHFKWIGGGFNNVWARDMEHFKEVVNKRFPNSYPMVDYSTVKPVTKSYAYEMDKMGWMMTC